MKFYGKKNRIVHIEFFSFVSKERRSKNLNTEQYHSWRKLIFQFLLFNL